MKASKAIVGSVFLLALAFRDEKVDLVLDLGSQGKKAVIKHHAVSSAGEPRWTWDVTSTVEL